MADDKREFPRFPMEEVVRVYLLPEPSAENQSKHSQQPLYLKAKNISQEGICLETRDFFLPNQILRLDFQTAHDGHTQAFATVVWSERTSCGLRFLKNGESPYQWSNGRQTA